MLIRSIPFLPIERFNEDIEYLANDYSPFFVASGEDFLIISTLGFDINNPIPEVSIETVRLFNNLKEQGFYLVVLTVGISEELQELNQSEADRDLLLMDLF